MNTRTIAILATTALLAALLAGCTSQSNAPTTHLRIDFAGLRPAVDVDIPAAGKVDVTPASPAAGEASRVQPYTARLQILDWENNGGKPVSIEHFSFGDCLGQVDGIPEKSGCQTGATAYWNLAVNGINASVGMDQLELHASDRVTWTLTPLPTQPKPGELQLRLDDTPPTRNATTVLHGWVSSPATVIVMAVALHGPIHVVDTVGEPRITANGNWSLERPVPPGETRFLVLASNADGGAEANETVVRLASGTVQVKFKGLPGHTDRNDTVWFDIDAMLSAPLYEGRDVSHPPNATAHDLMAAWQAQTEVPVTLLYYKGIGYFVSSIDGVGAPDQVGSVSGSSAWCYDYNGKSASFGISSQKIHAGDVLTWKLGCA